MRDRVIYNKVSGWGGRCLPLCLLLLLPLCAVAQVSVKAEIDPIEMPIGQQAQVTLTVEAPDEARVEFPVFQPRQQLVPGVELLDTRQPSAHVRVYTLTSFDGKLYYLPEFKVKVDGREYKSKSLALKVFEVEVDTTQVNKFYGPKDVQDNPFQWSDWSLLFWLSVVMLLLMAVGYYLYLRLRDNKPVIRSIRIVKRLLPHQKAMKEIEQIKADKMVSAADQKEYYTKLTDTLRKYIEERYGFSAMEMTSAEIIERLMSTGDQRSLDELRQLFQTADLVKFAKYAALVNENDANLVSAIDFINQTKVEQVAVEEAPKPQLSAEDRRTVKTRRLLKTVIWAIAAACAVLLCYVLYGVWQLIV